MLLQSGEPFKFKVCVIKFIDLSVDGEYSIERYKLLDYNFKGYVTLEGVIFCFNGKEITRQTHKSFLKSTTLAEWFDGIKHYHLCLELGIYKTEWLSYEEMGTPIGNMNGIAKITIR